MDLIDRQAAIDTMYKIVERNLDSSAFENDLAENPHIDVIVDELENLPSAEPEIVHCRDCKYYDGRPCGIVDYYNTESDFCSRAERIEK